MFGRGGFGRGGWGWERNIVRFTEEAEMFEEAHGLFGGNKKI